MTLTVHFMKASFYILHLFVGGDFAVYAYETKARTITEPKCAKLH